MKWKIKKGRTRIVILLPFWGVAIKIARVDILGFLRDIPNLFEKTPSGKRYFWQKIKFQILGANTGMLYTWRYFLFSGISANWHEFCFYRRMRNPFLQPTYFSFFGLLNVQKYNPTLLPDCDIFLTIMKLTDYHLAGKKCDRHTLENPDNFCLDSEGRLRILDYGSRLNDDFICQYGRAMVERFRPEMIEKYQK